MFKNLNTEALGVSGTQNEVIELALSHGFKGLELDLPAFAEQVEARGLAHSRRLLDSARLRLGSFRLPAELHVSVEPNLPIAQPGAGGVHHVPSALPTAATRPRPSGSTTYACRRAVRSTASGSATSTSVSRRGSCSRSPPIGRALLPTSRCTRLARRCPCRRSWKAYASRSKRA